MHILEYPRVQVHCNVTQFIYVYFVAQANEDWVGDVTSGVSVAILTVVVSLSLSNYCALGHDPISIKWSTCCDKAKGKPGVTSEIIDNNGDNEFGTTHQ